MKLKSKDLLGIEQLGRDEILAILDQSRTFLEVLDRPIPVVPALRGKTIVNLFFEPSTRTATSFSLAAKRLSADPVAFALSASSVTKGETLLDTARTLEAMKVDGVVIRHSMAGAPHFLASRLKAFVVNAGDGCHEHPTQALLDAFTLLRQLKDLAGRRILILGDIAHSRVARSDILAFTRLGAKVLLCAPPTLLPADAEALGCEVFYKLDYILNEVDVVNVLRLQLERQQRGLFPSQREYRQLYCLTKERVARAKPGLVVMHPGPMNRGIEIDAEVADSHQSVILHQVRNGVAVRMAVLYLLAGGDEPEGSRR
jgi:aspartate carbamoyltransferase catalytic subunit